MNQQNFAQTPTLTLAYMGDVVFELYIREKLVKAGTTKVKDLHGAAVAFVRAESQAQLLRWLEKELTEEEKAVVRRGRNAKSGRPPKNANLIDYRLATAFEALLGFLYLMQRQERLGYLLNQSWLYLSQEKA